MRINTNMAALNAWRNMSVNNGNVQKSLEKLSSGYRINRAADDAAGLAVSEKMRAQIRGTQMATRNAQDGISLVQTAEGALTETHSILQRMRELGVQASTSTLSAEDAAQVQTEFTQLRDEIDRIANNTTFNTKKLLNGEANIVTSITGAGKVANVYGTGDTGIGTLSLTATTAAASASGTILLTNATTPGTLSAALTISVNGKDFNFAAGKTQEEIAQTLNDAAAQTGVTVNLDAATNTLTLTSVAVGTGSKFTLNATGADIAAPADVVAPTADGADATITGGGTLGTDYTAKGNTITMLTGNQKGLTFTVAQAGAVDIKVEKNGSMGVQIGSEEGQQMKISIGSMTSASLGIATQNVSDQGSAGNAITALDVAINRVSTQRAQLGAVQNRLEHTVASLQVSAENLQGAESRIRDADMASEMATFTKNNILMQASQAMLAQANQSTQGILSLLR